MKTIDPKPSGPGVRFPPPLLFAGGLLVTWLLQTRFRSFTLFSQTSPMLAAMAVGYGLVLAGIIVIGSGMLTFARAHTAIIPMKRASSLVDTGPYRFTRNPMYTGMTVAYLGGALILNSGWALVILPIPLALLYFLVVLKEERYLSAEFGDAYADYRSRVKRWI